MLRRVKFLTDLTVQPGRSQCFEGFLARLPNMPLSLRRHSCKNPCGVLGDLTSINCIYHFGNIRINDQPISYSVCIDAKIVANLFHIHLEVLHESFYQGGALTREEVLAMFVKNEANSVSILFGRNIIRRLIYHARNTSQFEIPRNG